MAVMEELIPYPLIENLNHGHKGVHPLHHVLLVQNDEKNTNNDLSLLNFPNLKILSARGKLTFSTTLVRGVEEQHYRMKLFIETLFEKYPFARDFKVIQKDEKFDFSYTLFAMIPQHVLFLNHEWIVNDKDIFHLKGSNIAVLSYNELNLLRQKYWDYSLSCEKIDKKLSQKDKDLYSFLNYLISAHSGRLF